MYDSKHRFFELSSNPEKRVKILQKGLRELLLCDSCEQQFGRYEQYASTVFFGETQGRRSKSSVMLEGLAYKPLKLFFISLLWRLAITTVEFFEGAELGPHQERLRLMLLSEEPGNALQYPCLAIALHLNHKHIPDLLLPPTKVRAHGQCVWRVVVAGILLLFFVSSHNPPAQLHNAFLTPEGTMRLGLEEISNITFLHAILSELAKAELGRLA